MGNGVSLSAGAIRGCAERGIPISFLSGHGAPYAKVIAPELTGTVQTRRQQLLSFDDERGLRRHPRLTFQYPFHGSNGRNVPHGSLDP